jgi:hypothetical protein
MSGIYKPWLLVERGEPTPVYEERGCTAAEAGYVLYKYCIT